MSGSGTAPREPVRNGGRAEPGASAHSAAAEAINILLVDDEPKNLTVLETVLENSAYRLVRATSADEALLALIVDEFALLILDVQMPGMTGFELAEMIKQRKRNAHVPIIFLTAYYNEDEHVLEGYGSGAVDYLHKPVNAAVLRSKVAVFADLYKKSHELELANRSLLDEVAIRRRVEDELNELNETLEQRVKSRTDALRENEARLRHAANAARLTYLEVDFDGGEVRPAENFAAVMGYAPPYGKQTDHATRAELLLRHVVPEDRPRVETALRRVAEGESVAKFDYGVIGDDRKIRRIESEWFIESGADGKAAKTFVTNLDITARKSAEEEVRRSEERFRQLADSMPQMVWTASPEGVPDYYNARWYEFSGMTRGSETGIADWDSLLFRDDRQPFYDGWQRAVHTGEPYLAEYRLWDRHSHRYRWYLGRALTVHDPYGRVLRWIGTCTDIDEQKRSEQHLRQANHALEQFAFAASHDLQEPLRNVAIYSQMFTQRYGGGLNEDGKTYLGFINEGAQRMSRLVSDLLAFTQTVGTDAEPSTISDTEKALEAVLRNLAQGIQARSAEVSHDPLPPIAMNATHLEQLFQNLIGNALKYQRDDEPPRVHISAAPEGSRWHFVVRDNGIGIDPEYHELIFGVFKRLHGSGEKYSGTGIGLAICRKIVENYGGRIWVKSESGQGSSFHFTLPGANLSN